MIPIFSIALANSSGSTDPLLFRSKYLNAFYKMASSEVTPDDFYYNLFFNSLSKLNHRRENESIFILNKTERQK